MRFFRALFALLLWFPIAGVAHAQFPGCDQAQIFASGTITASGNTKLIANTRLPNGAIHVCSHSAQVVTSANAVTFRLIAGTGTACEIGTTPVQVSYSVPASSERSVGAPASPVPAYNLPSGVDLCLQLSGAVASAVVGVTYAIY